MNSKYFAQPPKKIVCAGTSLEDGMICILNSELRTQN